MNTPHRGLKYESVYKGIFRSRPNRFIAEVEINGQRERCHVKNTGRCEELLIPGARVYVNRTSKPERVTGYDLVTVFKPAVCGSRKSDASTPGEPALTFESGFEAADGGRLINIDSQAPNKVFLEYLQSGRFASGITHIKSEVTYGDSRFDFYVEANKRKMFIEVKGVTLEKDSVALFPDAPTERGVKHLRGLSRCINDSYEAHVVFVIQMTGIRHFSPNYDIHPAFGAALVATQDAGVRVSAVDCEVTMDSLTIKNTVPVVLEHCI